MGNPTGEHFLHKQGFGLFANRVLSFDAVLDDRVPEGIEADCTCLQQEVRPSVCQ